MKETIWRNWLVIGVCILVGWRQVHFSFSENCPQPSETTFPGSLPTHHYYEKTSLSPRWFVDPDPPSSSSQNSTAPCGIVYYYHIGCTGGRATNAWLQSHRDQNEFFTFWGGPPSRHKFVSLMDERVQNLTTWKVAHVHHWNYGNNASWEMGHLRRWKEAVQQQQEQQGCVFLGVVTFRDPLEHALAKFRYKPRNVTNAQFITDVRQQFQLKYFLYNFYDAPSHVAKQDKVTRALEIIDEFFPIVTLGSNLTPMVEQVSRWVGWDVEEMPRRGEHQQPLVYSKEEIKTLQRLLQEDGDYDLYLALQHRFNRKLDYLGW